MSIASLPGSREWPGIQVRVRRLFNFSCLLTLSARRSPINGMLRASCACVFRKDQNMYIYQCMHL